MSDKFSECFEYNNKIYVIPQETGESREVYINRVWYILKNNKNNLSEAILESRIIRNKQIFECDY